MKKHGHAEHHEHPRKREHDGHHLHHPRVHKNKGGHVSEERHEKDEAPHEVYAGLGSHVVKEAEKKKHGGKIHTKKQHHLGHVLEGKVHNRSDRKPRKHGGRLGKEIEAFSSAHHSVAPSGRHLDMA